MDSTATARQLTDLGFETAPCKGERLLTQLSADPFETKIAFGSFPDAGVALALPGTLCAVVAGQGALCSLAGAGKVIESAVEMRDGDDRAICLYRVEGRVPKEWEPLPGVRVISGPWIEVSGPVNGAPPISSLPEWLAPASEEREIPEEEPPAPSMPRRLGFLSAAEIFAATTAEVPWIASPILARGALTFLEASPKRGKTTLALDLMRAVMRGECFLGAETVRSPVVLLTEQGTATLRLAFERAGIVPDDPLHVLTIGGAAGTPWPTVCGDAAAFAKERGAVLAIDTLPIFAGLGESGENDSGAALAAVRPLTEAASQGLAVLAVRHERKSGGEVGEAGRGSSAFAGASDLIASLRRPETGGPSTQREIRLLSRLPLPFDRLLLDFVGGRFVSLGTPSEAVRQATEDRVDSAAFRVLRAIERDGRLTVRAIREKVGGNAGEIGAALRSLVEEGRLTFEAGPNRAKFYKIHS